MNAIFKQAMQTAAQLTAVGEIHAATATIQQALAGGAAAGAPSHYADGVGGQGRWFNNSTEYVKLETGTTQAGSFSNAAGRRDYLLYLPTTLQSASLPTGLVIMLHGCTQTPADFAAGTAMNALADQHGFVVLYPGQSPAANQSGCWNWFNPSDQHARAGEPAIIAGMAREIADRHKVDSRRIFAAGLSAGGAMAAILAETCPDLVSAIAVHSGLPAGAAHDLSTALAAMKRGAPSSAPVAAPRRGTSANARQVRTLVFHGRQDRTVHPDNGAQVTDVALSRWPEGSLQMRQETGRSAGGRSYLRTVHLDRAGHSMVERWEVQGAGHAWSGGSALGSHTDPKGPDASAAIIDFFLTGTH